MNLSDVPIDVINELLLNVKLFQQNLDLLLIIKIVFLLNYCLKYGSLLGVAIEQPKAPDKHEEHILVVFPQCLLFNEEVLPVSDHCVVSADELPLFLNFEVQAKKIGLLRLQRFHELFQNLFCFSSITDLGTFIVALYQLVHLSLLNASVPSFSLEVFQLHANPFHISSMFKFLLNERRLECLNSETRLTLDMIDLVGKLPLKVLILNNEALLLRPDLLIDFFKRFPHLVMPILKLQRLKRLLLRHLVY